MPIQLGEEITCAFAIMPRVEKQEATIAYYAEISSGSGDDFVSGVEIEFLLTALL
jgi:hypothetical protein